MNKLNRGRLLLSTCLSGVALAWTPAALAQTQDKEPNWQPRAEVDARAADKSSQVSFDLFAPVAQNDSSLLFVAGRIGTDERYDRNGSVTIGGRGKIGEDVAIGVNAGVDFYKTDITSRDQTAVSFGLEGFTSIFDLHVNYRLPVNSPRTIGYLNPNASPVGVVSIENNRLIERKSGWRLEEVPLAGANAELGATVPLAKNLNVRLSGAAFDYRDQHASDTYRGVRGGLELGVEDPLGTGGRFTIGAELQNDNRWGTQARGIVRLSIPLGHGANDRGSGSTGLDRQMGDRVRRDYVTPSGTRYTDLTSTNFAIDARTGAAFGGVYFTSGSGVAGSAGTSTATTTLSDAVTRAGANGIVVALGNAGNIASTGVTLATNQYLVGGASSVDVKHADGSVTAFSFGGTNGAIVGSNAGGAAITLGTGSVVRDVTVRGAGSGILANGVGGFSLERVVIENTGGAGLTLTNTLGNVVVDGITIRGGGGAGLVVNGGSNVTVRNSTIGGGAGAIDINDAGGNLTTSLSNLTLSATGGNVLDIDGSGAGTVTVAALSGIGIAGGNGETGGFAARYVTFDSSTAAGVQAVNAGTMQVGTTAARVNGAGVSITESDGALSFANLNIANNGGTGLTVNNTKTGTFTLSTATGTTDTTGGAALVLDPLLIDLNFTSVRSINSTGAGIVLDQVQGAGTGGNALTIGTLTISGAAQQGIWLTGGSTGQVTIGGGSITNSGAANVQVGQIGAAGSGGTIGLTYGGTVTDNAGTLIYLANAGGTIRFNGAITGAGSIIVDSTTSASNVTFAGGTTITGNAGAAVYVNGVAGAVNFTGALSITNPAAGIQVTNTLAGSSVNFLGNTSVTGAATSGVSINNVAGAVTFGGPLTITNPGDRGIIVTGSLTGSSVTFGGATTITGAAGPQAILLATLQGSTTFNGPLTIANPTGTGILIGTVPGGVTFGDVDITGLGAARGVDLRGTLGNVTFSTLDITGTGAAGSTGIDLTGATNAGAITITNPSVIQGVDIGVNLTNANISGSFRYGDGNAANGLQSRITANTVIVVAGMNASQGTYNFADVVLDGNTNNITGGSFTAYYVLAGATGAGTANDPGSIAGAAASGAQYIVLLNNPTGGQDVIDTGTLAGGALNLTSGQALVSFLNTDFFAVTGAVVPANLIVTNLGPTGIVNSYAGSGAAILTSSAGSATVNLANNTKLDGVIIQSVTGTGVVGTGVSNVILQNSNISGATGAVSLADGGAAASATLTNLNLSASGGTVLALNGAGAGTLNVSGTGVNVAGTGSAQAVAMTDVSVGTLDIGAVTTGNNAGGLAAVQLLQVAGGTLNIGSVTVGGTSTGAGLGIAASSATVNVGAVTTSNTAGQGVVLSGNTGNITLGAISVTNSGSDGVRLIGNTGSVELGTITATNVAGAGLRISNTTGDVLLAGASITGANNGIEVANLSGHLSVTGATSIANSAGAGIVLNGIGGNVLFGATTIANSAGIVLGAGSTGLIEFGDTDITGLGANKTGVDARASEGTVKFATLDITGTSTTGTRGIDMTGAAYVGSFSVLDSSSITGVGTGVDLTNAHISGTFGFGDLSNTDADGAHSVIDAITPIAIGGFNTSSGLYNFSDVALIGDTTGLATNPVTLYFVQQGSAGTGTKTDPGSIAGAAASGAQYIILLNNPAGGNDTLDVAGLGSLTLGANQHLISFLNGDTQTVGGNTPANMFLYGLTPGIVTNPFAGSGSALLTNTGAGATVTLSNGSVIDGVRIGGAGIGVYGSGVTGVSITNSIISGGTGAIQLRSGGVAATATLTNLALSATGGKVLDLNGSGGGSLTVSGSGLSVTATGNATAVLMNSVGVLGALNFGAVSTQVAATSGVDISYVGGGTVNFASIGIGGTSAGNGISLLNNSSAINLGTVNIANTAATGIDIVSNLGDVTLGNFTINNAGLSGIVINGLAGSFSALGGSIGNSFSTGISLTSIAGSVNFTGGVTIANPGAAGIRLLGGSTGAITFADVDITGLTAGTTGLDARGTSGNVTFATLDITGASATGTRGIDLTGATFGGNLIITGSSTITGVGTGVDLTNAAITGTFRFGDGSNTDANGAASTISGTVPLVVAGLNALQGNYDFADVNMVGDTSSLATSATVYWVLAGATGAGTRTDPGNLAGAAASGADIIILVNNPAGGDDTLDVNGAGGTGGTFTLMTGQQLRGFLNGDTISLPGGAPANVVLYNIATGFVTNPFAGSGAPTLTSSVGGTDTVLVSGNNIIDGVRITSAGTGVYGSAASNITISNSILSGSDSAIELVSGGGAADAALSNLVLTTTGASIPLALYAGGGGSMTVTQLSNITINQGIGSNGAYLIGATFDADLATAGYQTVDASMVFGSSGARLNGSALNLTGALGALNFTALSIYNQNGPGIYASGSGLTLTSTAGTIDTVNSSNITLTGTQANLVLDNVVHLGSGTAIAATGITGVGAGGQAITVANLQSVGGTNAILFTGNNSGTVSFGAASSISAASGAAIAIESGTGTLNFNYLGSVTQANNAALLDVTNHNGSITFGAGSNLDATNGTGLQFSNADGTYAFNGTTTLHGGDAGIDIVGGSAGSFTFGAGTTITNPSGTTINIADSTAGLTYAGNVSQANNAALLSILNHNGGTIAFTGTLSATGGTGLQFDNADATYNFTGTTTLNGGDAGIDILNDSAGNFTFGANTAVTSPSGVAFNLSDSNANVTYSGSLTQANNAALVSILNHSGGTLTFNTGTLSATNGTGLQFDNADGTYNFAGTTTLNGGDAGVDIGNGSAGAFTFGAGTTITSPTGTAFSVADSTASVIYNGSLTQANNAALLSVLNHSGGTLNFTGGTLSATGGDGLSFDNADGTYSFGSATLSGGAQIGITNGSAGTFTFGAGTSVTDAAGADLFVSNSTANITYAGQINQSQALLAALDIGTHSGGTIDFTGATFNVTDGTGVSFFDADGTYSFGDVALSGGARLAVLGGSAGTFTFGNVDITGLAANTTAVNLTGATGNVTFATLDITGTSNTGTRGIDLTGSTTAGNVIISGSSQITGVGIGIDLTNAAITGNFRYGDGSNVDANGAASNITAVTPLVIAGLNGGVGNYNFADVNLNGDTTNLSVSAYFVLEGASGTGSRSDPGSLAGAEAAGAAYIVLLNNPNGGTDILDATAGAGGSLDLAGGQILLSFRDQDSFTVGGGAPANVVLYNVQTGVISNPFSGSGAPTLTASGANATVTLGGGNIIDGVVIANSGTGAGVLGNGAAAPIVIRNSTISGGAAGAIRIYDNAANVTLALSNLTLAANGGNILNLDGSGAGSFILSELSNLTVTHTTETGGFVFNDLTFDSDTVTAGLQAVSAGNLTLGTTGSRITGDGLSLTNVFGTLNFGDLNIANNAGTGLIVANSKANDFVLGTTGGAIDTTGGTAINLDPLTVHMVLNSVGSTGGAYGILLDQVEGDFTVTGSVGVTGATNTSIAIRNNSAQTDALDVHFQGATTLDSTTTAGAGVLFDNNFGASVDFTGGLAIYTASGTGFATNSDGTVTVTGAFNSIYTGSGRALSLNNGTIGAAGMNFAQITAATTAGTAVSIAGVTLTGALNIGGLDIDGSATAVSFNDIHGTGGINLTGTLDIDTTGIGILFSNDVGTVNIANAAGSTLTIDGATNAIRVGGATGGTLNIGTSGGSASIGATASSTTAAIAFNSSTGVTLNYGGTINATTGSVLSSVNSSLIATLSGAITSTTTGVAFNFGNAGGIYTISGAVSHTGGAGVLVNAPSTANVSFLNASKTFSTGTGPAISMAGSGTLSFLGGGLGITTTTGTGLLASGAGTLTVTGANNTITVGDATALQLGGGTIGATGVTFANITAAPSVATAVLVTNETLTGALNIGGLSVTGAGTGASFSNLSGAGGVNLTGTLDLDTSGIGLQFSNNVGTINIANVAGSTLTIDGASRGIFLNGMTGGTVNVASAAGSASIGATTSSTTTAIDASGSAGTLNYGGTIRATAGSVLSVANSTGSITLAGDITSASGTTAFGFADADGTYLISGNVNQSVGAGVTIAATSSGAITFSGASKKFNTGVNTAINMIGTGTLSFTGGGLDIDTTSGTGLSATAGTVSVLGSGNTITTATGQILSLSGVTSGSGGITFDALTATGTVANNGILLSGLSGAAFNGGTVNIGGTSGASSDGIKVTTGTAAITFGATTIGTAGSNAIELLNSNSAVTFGTMNLSGANGSTVVIGGSTGAVTLGTGTITATGAANYAVSITGGTGDVTVGSALAGTRMVEINDHETGTVTFSGNMSSTVAGILITNVNSGLISFTGQTLALNATSSGVTMAGNSGGTIDFNMAAGGNGLDIVSTGTGFNAGSGGTVIVRGTGNSISTTGAGTALGLQNVTIGANGFTFDSVSANGATTGILLNGVATTGPALSLGTVNLQGITSRGIDVTGILGAGLSITDLDIGLNSNSAVALNLNGTTINAPIIIGDFDVTNTGGAGTSIGVDLRGTLGGASILLGGQLGASSSISGVGTGIYLNASTNALFTYGDGESGIDTGSTISATTAIDATNAPTLGTYDFRDVSFSGSPGAGFGLNHIYFVDSDGGTGGGNGSGSDGSNPMTLAAAELIAAAQDMIILVNNGNAISAAGSNGNDSLVLASNVQVRGFGDGVGGGAGTGSAPINITLTVPSTILLSGGTSFNIADPTGNGAATLTSAAGANLITLGATGNHLSGFILDGGGAVSRGIKDNGAGATNTLLDYLTVRNFGTMGIEITPSTSTTIDHVSFSGNPGGDVLLNAANSVLTNIVSNGGGITLNNATGTTTLTNVNLTGGAGLVFTNAAGTINATNVDVTNPLVAGLTISGGTAAFNFDSTSSITKSSAGASLSIGGGHATGIFSYAGTLNITGGTGLQFDNADGTYNFTGNTTLAGGDAGIDILNGSGGSFVFGTNTTITSPTGTAFNVSGSTAAITYSGNITQANNAALVSFLNHSGGTVTFQTGTLSATNGTGLQFDNADATYAFNGTTTLNGGDAGVDILNGSGGTFTFASGASITSPTGTAFNVSGSTAAVTYNGSITQANNAALVNVLNHSGGTLTFQGGTLSATNGTGLQFNNADGTYNFNGTTTLNGGDAGVDIVNGSDGTFGFGSGAAITHAAAGDAFVLTDSNSNLTYAGTVSDANGYAVRIDNHDAGAVTFNSNSAINSSGANALGLSVTNSNGGTVNFNGTTTLSTQANNAVTLSANAGGTVAFSSVGTALGITTTSGTAFVISGGGTINATGPNSTITTGSGTIFDISNAAAVTTTLGMTFASASNTLGANGILISRTAGTLTGSVTVNGGSITATTRGIDVDGGTLSLDYAGSVATSGTTGRSVEVTNITSGAITASGNLTDNALGINIANNTGGSINFYGQSITLNTVANVNAVTLASNTGANITFSSAAGGNGVDITASGTGNGIDFTGGGTLIVYSTGNSVQTATGQILNLVNGNVGSLGLVFDSLTSTGSTNGSAININNVDGTGTLSATTVSIAGTTGATADGIFYGGGSTMNVNLGGVTIANTGDEGIEINGTGNGTFTAGSVTINNTGGNGVEINNSNNTVSLNGGAIGGSNDPTGFGVYVLNGTGTVSIASSITKTTGNSVVFVDNHETNNVTFSGAISATGGLNNGIVVQNVNSGTISFSGNATLTTGGNTAVNLLNNTGGTITFPNGGLVITTTSGTGFNATGGGTVGTAGSGNRITSTTGTALNVVNTSIGSGGLRFQSISSNGASSGIILNNTGTFGGINVTGTGAAGSGGTIQNSSGDGISLTSTENVRLAYMNVTNNLGDGIGGSNINGFLIDNMLISGNGDDAGTDESGINIANLSGTASNGARPTGIFNSTIQNNNEFEVQITNSTGTLTNFQVVNSTFASNGVGINGNGTSPHGNIFNFLGTGTSAMGISVSGSNFTGNWNAASPPTTIVGSGLFIDSSGTSMTAQVSGSFFTNTNNGINVSTGPGSTTLTYSIDGNTFTGTRSTAINDFQNGNAPFTRTVNGRITNNIIGNNAVTNSGSNVGNGISIANEGGVNANYLISGNTIQQIQTTQGIVVNVGLVGQATGNGTTNVTILNNTIRNINGSRGLVINNNQNTGGFPTVNVSISGNSFSGIAGQAGNGQYLRLAASGGGTINVTQGQATASAIATELDDANGFNDTTKVSIGVGTFNYGQPAPTQPPASVPLP